MGMIIMMNHVLGCLWFMVGKSCSNAGWVQRMHYDEEDYGIQYLASLQWSLAQFTPGATHLQPECKGERVFSVVVLCLALILATCFISSITSTMGSVWEVNRYKNTQSFLLKKFLGQMGVSRELGSRVTRYVECVVDLRHR